MSFQALCGHAARAVWARACSAVVTVVRKMFMYSALPSSGWFTLPSQNGIHDT